jgi:hypothetical protein
MAFHKVHFRGSNPSRWHDPLQRLRHRHENRSIDITQLLGNIIPICLFQRILLGSPYRVAISQAILELQETDWLLILKSQCRKEKRGGGACKVSHI